MSGRANPAGPRPSGIITLLTDFGLSDPYVGIVKGVVLGINPGARVVDLTHAVPPQDVLRAALALETAHRFFPDGTVHLAVVDPGVGGPRRLLAVSAAGHYFVGPDNGLLGFLFERGRVAAVALTNRRYQGPTVSRTFQARDILAPVAAHCSRGVPLSRFGPVVRDPVRLPWPVPRRSGDRVHGQVLLADRFGNLLSNVRATELPAAPAACVVEIAGTRIEGLVETYGDRPPGALGAVVDSSGRVEVFVREGSAQGHLGVGPGAAVILWAKRAATRAMATTRSRGSSRRARPAPDLRSPPPRRARRPSSRTRGPSSAPRRGSR